ncbi:MAG TPA: alpha/beta hydrolase [Anaerolineaceae bacterium]|nr:alpha/beta hydrolase [Anaerolineaceae bacterium]
MITEKKQDPQDIHYQICGKGDKTVILVHGLLSSLREWDRMSQKLVSGGYRTIALDLPGHGESLKPAEVDFYSADSFYKYFKEWIDHLNLAAPPVLIGHSFGGNLCLRYTLDHQQDLGGLVLMSPFLAYDQVPGLVRFVLASPRIAAGSLKNAPFGLIKFILWAGNLIRRNSRLTSFLSKSELHQMAIDFKKCSPNIAYLSGTVGDITVRLVEVKLPALLIWGKHDHILSASWYLQGALKIPHATRKVLNAGHNPHLSNISEVYPILVDFLEANFAR